ncbi:type I polyketide synthase [Streptomyces lydicus]|uniref:type I polyketide synthase n=1 Tax=Streptomyces lydicus TaxID=47763 RepID=UPI00379D6D5E
MAGLAAVATGQPAAGVVSGAVRPGGVGRTVFVFPGQGSQWLGMGRELAASSPVFAARLAECERALAPYVDWSLDDVLAGPENAAFEAADVVQPALWAVMVSLAAVWQAAGVQPDALVGHSQGEIAAACVAGILSLDDAARVVALRSRALTALAGRGGMLSVAESAERVRDRLSPWGDQVSIAAVNGPVATVVSGTPEALRELAEVCEKDGVRARLIPVDYASHSAQVDALEQEILDVLRGITPGEAQIPMISSMSGEMLAGPEMGPDYWYASLRAPVEFDRAVRTLAESGHRVFIETSPHPVLTAAITDTVEDTGATASLITGTLRRDDGGADRLLASLAEAHVHGLGVDWTTVLEPAQWIDLPTYAFQHERYWLQAAAQGAAAAGGEGAGSEAEAKFWAAVEAGKLRELADTLAVDDERLAELLPALASWRRRERDDSAVADWRYGISWVPVSEPASWVLTGTWLIVAPSGQQDAELVQGCVQALTARGAEVITTEVAAGELERAALAERIAVTLPEDVQLAGVISLLALDESPLADTPAVSRGLAGTLGLVQALGDANITAPLWAVTQGAVATAEAEPLTHPVQAQTWGLGRVVGLEHPDRWGGLVDLPQAWDERIAARLCAVLADGTEDQVAVRTAGVMARRLVRAPRPSEHREQWAPTGTVLITGGTGAIGGHVGRWLAGRGAERVVLTSRSGPAAADVAALAAELAAAGTHVDVVACDIAQRADISSLLGRIAADGPLLSGVVHAAGVGHGGAVADTTVAGLATAVEAKTAGTVWLDELTADLDLDAFVLFSSGAATWGSGLLSAYAAGNAYLDALAENRRARGLAATSVAWGLWGGGGMVGGEAGEQLRRYGMRVIEPGLGIRALAQAVDGGDVTVTVADVDWERFAPTFTLRRPSPLIASLPEVQQALASDTEAGDGPAAPGADTALGQQLAGLSRSEQDRLLTELVRGEAAAVLGHASIEAVEPTRAFRELGFDSLTAVELRNRMNAATGLQLSSTLVFDYPSPVTMAAYLRTGLLGVQSESAAPVVTAAAYGEPIAVVGMGCRFPGGVESPEQLWDLVAAGTDAVSGFPQDRGWETEGDSDAYARVGGFVYDASEFDAGFFGISPREALAMDPQQRMLLEVSWEALERAGIDPTSLRGSQTGVFAGATYSGYGMSLMGGASGSEGYLLTGSLTAVISGRVAYSLGLEGPAVTVDTACSSSLVALHQACQSLRAGECTMALAGGVAVMATAGAFSEFSEQQGMAANGRCKAFSADADGIGWGEGAGMVVLERLSDARRNGHQVLAVIPGSAMNQDGASNGLTAPNGPSQQRVIRAALANAQLSTGDVDVVEAHGTGTKLGDPIEAQALLATYGQDRPEGQPLWLGSVKSNIGHPQTAAGVAGVIKMVLALQHGVLPRTLYADEPSPHVDWSAGQVRLLTEARPWHADGRPRRAGVSAFGVSGTNVHVIVEEAPEGVAEEAPERELPVLSGSDASAWLVSGRSAESLAAQAGRLREFTLSRPELEPADAAWSLATARSVFEHRAVVTGADREGLAAGLAAVATGQPAAGVTTGVSAPDATGRVAFVFPGQGSQWLGMGRELAVSSPVFAARLAECGAALAPYVDWSLDDVLAGAEGAPALETADVVQPALWAVMVSLAAVWQAAGVHPDALVGHSQGEIAAACVAGILSLDDAARVVALRSRALTALAGRGGMLSVAEPASRVRDRLTPWGDQVSVAAVNGPSATVVSGTPEALQELVEVCEKDGVRARLIPVDYASHSAQVDALEQEILDALRGITPGEAQIPMISAMSGEMMAGPEMGPDYWYASLRATVEFDRAIRTLAESGHRSFIEVSPHPVLTAPITDTVEDTWVPASLITGTLRRDDGGADRLLASLAEAHVHGAPVGWTAVLEPGQRIDLPTYAFQRQRFWPELADRTESAGGTGAEAEFWAAVEDGNLRELADTLAVDDERLGELLPALASWRRRQQDDSAVADWRYGISWVPVTDSGTAVLTGTWLLVVPAGDGDAPLTRGCLRALSDRGAHVAVTEIGADEAGEADRTAIAARITASLPEGAQVTGVVSLLALDETPLADTPTVSQGLAGTLGLIQALGDAGITAPLWTVTQGAVTAGPGDVLASAVQAQIWGLGRVVGLEHPDRWGGLIDLPTAWDERVAGRFCAALADGTEDQVALRPAGIMARRLVRTTRPSGRREQWTPRDTVLITGGTGSVGRYVGTWLAEHGTERVVLTSRSGPAAAEVAALAAELAGAGSRVDVVACDMARRTEVAGLLDRIAADGPPLRAVLHAANAGRQVTLGGTDLEDLAVALGAKAAGAVWLDELTADLELDAFVLFSSIAATWGSNEHGAYAAGNAFLDALAEGRRARGLVASSVAWGVWDTRDWDAVNAVVEHRPGSVTPARLVRQGMNFLDPERALTALGQVVADEETYLAVADVDWARFAPVFSAARPRPLLDRIAEARPEQTAAPSTEAALTDGAAGELAQRLSGKAPVERERLVSDLVRTHAAAVLGYGSLEEVSAGRAFRDMGFDSLTAVELRSRLNAATGLQLPSTVVFDYPSPAALARQIVGEVLGVTDTEATPSVPVPVGDLAEPIAIVGMGCRYPGGVDSPERLWELLASGGDAISGFPQDRGWDVEGLFDPDPDNPGTSYVQEGGFLQGAAEFDPRFFGISPREAMAMDPQQRLLLEISWEAVERAGIDPESLRGSLTGVFAGAAPSGYGAGLANRDSESEGYLITGNTGSVISGRVSYAFGLEGPAVTVDTACSSSLVALHQACQSLRAGECTMALAGGVMVVADPTEFVSFSRQRVLAADGRCKAFSAEADGMGIAEGAGVVLVERLSDARRNGHQVLAVIRGSAINQDGASNGLTAPNGPSQQRVIQAALANARLSAADVDVIEAHGTGTELGDPIEAQALLATYGQERDADRPVWLGSLKSNIGHTQQAAGVAGVMKMVLALQHGELPRTLHAEEPSPHVDWSAGAVELLSEPVAWSAGERPRRAGVSAFGISGTNAHVIVEEAPTVAAEETAATELPVLSDPGTSAWLVSARDAEGLAAQAGRLREYVLSRPELEPAGVAWSLATSRSAFGHRSVVLGSGREGLAAGLGSVAVGRSGAGVVSGVAGAGRVGFVFAGQGAQRVGMGRELYGVSPVFAAAFDEVCGLLEGELGLPVRDVVLGRGEDAERLAVRTVFAQSGLFAVEVGLVAMLAACGVVPDAVAGHSVGEFAAAYVAGVLSLEDACRLVAVRARLMEALPEGGAMAAIAAGEAEMREALAEVPGVEIAAVNGPASVVVSGDTEAVERVVEVWGERGRRVRRLRVSHAFHSARMVPVLEELDLAASKVTYNAPQVPWACGVTGGLVEEVSAEYWAVQAREAVRYADAVGTLAEQGISVFIEIGPDGTLSGMGSAALADQDGSAVFVPVLRKDVPAGESVLTALARAYVRGAVVDWTAVLEHGRRVELPTYAFQRQRYWPQAAQVSAPAVQDVAGSAADAEFWAAVEGGSLRELADTLAIDEQRPFSEVLPALASWHRRQQDDSAVADWRYGISWTPVSEPASAVLSGTWLVVAPSGQADAGLVQSCVRALSDRGAQVVVTETTVDEVDRAALAERITGVLPEDAQLAGVLSLLALDEASLAELPVVHRGVAGTLGLVQALGDAGIAAPLWVLTQGAVATGSAEAPASPVQAQIWGLGRVVGLEHPDRWGGLIDVPSAWDDRIAARFCALLADGTEDQLALRGAGVMARRLVRAARPASGREQWVPRGSVLITGGTGAIGGNTARWLAGRGAHRLVLTSRSGPAAAEVAALAAELAASGSHVEVMACDMAQRDEVAGLLDRIAASGPALTGVVHSAGLGEATPLEDFSLADLARVSAVKTAGAVWLDELTADLDLDAFVLFSSIAATWGSGLQPGYAAANAFLDALAERRRARGLAATSVAWGLWGGAGMGAGEASVQLQRHGLGVMDPGLGIQALAQAVDSRDTAVTVADVDWERFAPTFTLRRPSPLIASLPEVQQALASGAEAGDGSATSGADTALGQRLAGLSRAEQDRLLTDLVRTEAAAVLGYTSIDVVEPERAFKELGFDSLTAVELRNRLNAATGLQLPATLIFDYPNPAVLAEYLWTEEFQDEATHLPLIHELDKLESALAETAPDDETRELVAARLQAFLAKWSDSGAQSTSRGVAQKIESATDDEVFEFIHKELGRS